MEMRREKKDKKDKRNERISNINRDIYNINREFYKVMTNEEVDEEEFEKIKKNLKRFGIDIGKF